MKPLSDYKLVRRKDEAFLFDVVERSTGRVLSEDEVAALQPPAPKIETTIAFKTLTKSVAKAKPFQICGEGDSWISFLYIPFLPRTFFNVIEESYTCRNIGTPTHTFAEILKAKQYEQVLGSGLYRVLVFSGGGNDLLGGGRLSEVLRKKSEGGGATNPAAYIKQDKLKATIDKLETGYRQVAKEAKAAEANITMLIHGYAYAIPRKNGDWLGRPLKDAGFAHDEDLSSKIVRFIVDAFNTMLAKVANDLAHVKYVDVRKAVGSKWRDELHPTTEGARAVAARFKTEINKLLTS